MNPALFWLQMERIGFAGVVLIAFFLPITTSPIEILFPICASLTLVVPVLRNRLWGILQQPTAQAFIGLFAVLCIGLIYSDAKLLDGLLILKKYSRYLMGILLFTYFSNENRREWVINAYLTAIAVMVVASYAKVYGGLPIGTRFADGSVFKDHIQTSYALLVGLIFLMYRYLYFPAWRWGALIAMAFITYQLFFLCAGRTGYVLFIALGIMGMLKRYGWKGLLLSIGGVAALFFALFQFSTIFQHRLTETKQEYEEYQAGYLYTSTGERLSYFMKSLELVKSHPLLGTGTGSFQKVYERVEPVPAHRTENPHNEYLHLAVQNGVLGVLALFGVFIAPWYQSRRWTNDERFLMRTFILLMAVGCIMNSWLLDSMEGHTFAFMIAMLVGIRPPRNWIWTSRPNDERPPALAQP